MRTLTEARLVFARLMNREARLRKIIVGTFLSLDGVMQAPGGPGEDDSGGFKNGGWTVPYFDEVVGKAMGDLFTRPFELLIGRRTYDLFAAHWPHAAGSADDAIARQFNQAIKHVATRSPAPLEWCNSVALRDVAMEVPRLKHQAGPDLLVQGSSVLLQTLLAYDLVDELRLIVFPVVLGEGKRLFGSRAKSRALKLIDSAISPSGVTISSYVPAGHIEIGTIALQ